MSLNALNLPAYSSDFSDLEDLFDLKPPSLSESFDDSSSLASSNQEEASEEEVNPHIQILEDIVPKMASTIVKLSQEEFEQLYNDAVESFIEDRWQSTSDYVSEKVLNFLPKKLLAEINLNCFDDPIDDAKKHLRLGLAIIHYVNDLPRQILTSLEQNKDLDYRLFEYKNSVKKLQMDDGSSFPEGVQKIICRFIFWIPKLEHLEKRLNHYKNKYVAEIFGEGAIQFLSASENASSEEKIDLLQSASQLAQWAAIRLDANRKQKKKLPPSLPHDFSDTVRDTF